MDKTKPLNLSSGKSEHSSRADAFSGSSLGSRLGILLRTGSPSQRVLAEFILRNPIRIAAASIDELARATGVSAPTVSRFARELGLSGFAEMRGAAADAMQALMDPVAKLRERLRADPATRGVGETFDAIRRQIALIDSDAIEEIVLRLAAQINQARTVYIMGFGLSANIAGLLFLGLQPFHPQMVLVVEAGGTEVAAGNLMRIAGDDLLIAITFPRYGRDPVNLTRYARDRKARVAVLTDSSASPLAAMADELVLVPSSHPVLSSSMVAALAVVETLVAAVMLSDPVNVERADRLTEAIEAYLHHDPE